MNINMNRNTLGMVSVLVTNWLPCEVKNAAGSYSARSSSFVHVNTDPIVGVSISLKLLYSEGDNW